MNYITFKHSGNAGDIIYSLSSVKAYCERNEIKANYYIKLNAPSTFTSKQHPVGDVMMNQKMFDMLKPLIEAQPYIVMVDEYEDQHIDFDLDNFRSDYRNLSAGNIQCWYSNSFPQLVASLENPCIFVEPIPNDYTIINRTSRYNNSLIDYTILSGNLRFVGVDEEYTLMKAIYPEVERLEVSNFLELAQYIAGCQLFVGNQSMAFAIAEQLKADRILEQYVRAPNVIPQGGRWAVFHTQEQFKKIINGK